MGVSRPEREGIFLKIHNCIYKRVLYLNKILSAGNTCISMRQANNNFILALDA